MKSFLLLLIAASAGLGQSASKGTWDLSGESGPAGPLVTAPSLVSIALMPASSTQYVGTYVQFIAMGIYSDGSTQNITALSTWSSSSSSVAELGSPGSPQPVDCLSAGSSSISATYLSTTSITTLICNPTATTLPQRWVNSRESLQAAYTNTIALPALGTGGSWSCHGTAEGPYGSMPSAAAINAAIADAEACRGNFGDSTLISIPAGTLISQTFGGAAYINLTQSLNPVDSSSSPIVLDSSNPLPTTDPLTGNPHDQRVGTYNIASRSGLVRAANVVTVTTMNPMAAAPSVGDLATIWLPDDKHFQGQYTVCGPPITGCINPTTTRLTYQQTGPNATTQNGVIFSLQHQNAISSITTSGCSASGGACTLTIDFAADPTFSINDRFEIVNSTCAGCITGDPQAFNTTWYVASVTSNVSCATCRITATTYTEYFSNSAAASNGTALHFNHILADQIACCMYTLESTGGGGEIIFGDQNNYHNYLIADAEIRSQLGNTTGLGVLVEFEPNAYNLSPLPATNVSGCNGLPAQANCDQPVHVGIDRSYIHSYSFPVVARTTNSVTMGVQLDCGWCFVTNSYMQDIHLDGAESHAIHVKSGLGPFKIVDNYIEGTSENIFASYVPHPAGLPNGYYCDWEVRRNWLTKNMFESLNSGGNIPDGSGKYFQYLLKNNLEFKNVCNALVDGNIFEKSAGGTGEQQGVLMGNNATGDNGTGRAFALGAQSHDVTYSNNIYRHAMGVAYIPTRAAGQDGITFGTHHYAWLNNLMYDLGNITLYGRNSWGGSNWTFAFSDLIQLANRGGTYNCTATSSTSAGISIATQTCSPTSTLCVGPSGAACGIGIQAGDWVEVHGCSDSNYNVVAPVRVPSLSSDPTLSSNTFQYMVPPAAGATTTGCVAANAYGLARFVTFAHNTAVQNFNYTNPTYNNVYFTKMHTFGAEGIMGGDVGAQAMVRDWHIQNNVFSIQLPPNPSPMFFYCAPNGKSGTLAESICWDSTTLVWTNNAITGFTPSSYTEYNSPAGIAGTNNAVSPPVTDLMGLSGGCSGVPDNTCIGFQGNLSNNSCGVLGCGVATNTPDFAPSTQDYHVFALQPGPAGSSFAAGNPGQASDGGDSGVNFTALDVALGLQQYLCATACGSGPYP